MPAVQSARSVKRKIRAVGNIKKITRAMQMVSAAKLKKVQQRLMELRPYADKIVEFLKGLSAQVKDLDFPLFQARETVKRIGVVVVMADKGLCGSYNANMMRYVQRFLDEKKKPHKVVAEATRSVNIDFTLIFAPVGDFTQTYWLFLMPRASASLGLISTKFSCCNSASHGFERVSSPPPSYSTNRPEVRINGKSLLISLFFSCTDLYSVGKRQNAPLLVFMSRVLGDQIRPW